MAGTLVTGVTALPPAALAVDAKPAQQKRVDVELVLAVDVSYSMDLDELALQRDGYVQALTSKDFLDALRLGPNGAIVVTYVEWAGVGEQKVVADWQLIDGLASAQAFANKIAAAPIRRVYRTSISGALDFSNSLFPSSGYRGLRRVIDISGDGTNNQGALVEPTRDAVVAGGVTINGLPLLLKRPNAAGLDTENLDVYYEDCVIGGPGAFVIAIQGKHEFAEAIKAKLVLEVAGVKPRHPELVRYADGEKRISCTLGEKMWLDRWGN